jgi:hypothetical protein
MRHIMLAVLVLAAATGTPALAEEEHSSSLPQQYAFSPPSFNDCYRLAWVRGVHVEQDELPAFAAECMAGRIPFDSGYHADTVVPESK